MYSTALARTGLFLSFLIGLSPATSSAVMPSNPVTDSEFMRLPDGSDMSSIRVNGARLSLITGAGHTFGSAERAKYERLKEETLNDPNHKVQWALMDLDSHQVLAQSLGSRRRIFGASTSKVYVGGALLDKQQGELSKSQLQLMANMIVVSSNTAWTNLQQQIGDGNSNRGRAAIHAFTQRMGYLDTFGFQGSWGSMHGNELTAYDLVEFMHDTYKGEYPGAEVLWKLMHTSRTGASRAKKYIPREIFVGGKTGTYDGATEIDDVPVSVKVRNHLAVFNVGGHQYALAVLADNGLDESSALLAGGLLRDYTSYRP